MNFFKYKKYFFTNISVIWSFVVLYFIVAYNRTSYPPPNPNDAIALGGKEFFLMGISIFILFWVYIFTILEILIRKTFIKRFFPNLKFNLKIKIPTIIINIYNIIFFTGFILNIFFVVICIIFSIPEFLIHLFHSFC